MTIFNSWLIDNSIFLKCRHEQEGVVFFISINFCEFRIACCTNCRHNCLYHCNKSVESAFSHHKWNTSVISYCTVHLNDLAGICRDYHFSVSTSYTFTGVQLQNSNLRTCSVENGTSTLIQSLSKNFTEFAIHLIWKPSVKQIISSILDLDTSSISWYKKN